MLETENCVVCDFGVEEFSQASCQFCGGNFHQPWDETKLDPCGRVISHSDALALVYMCNNCFTESEDPDN